LRPDCGVVRRLNRCIDEKIGRMLSMQNPCIVLDRVVCEGVYHGNCPREFLPCWREIWLERVNEHPDSTGVGKPHSEPGLSPSVASKS
jgi:hypothetical protein